MSPARSLFPIPGPDGSTTERIILQMPDSGGDMSALWSALIAGVAVALITHRTNRSREGENWLRQRVFDVTKTLSDTFLVIDKECRRTDIGPELILGASGRSFQRYLDEHDWSKLDEAIKRYNAAISEGMLLMPSSEIINRLEMVRSYVNATARATKTLSEAFLGQNEIWRRDFEQRNMQVLEEFRGSHTATTYKISHDYLLPGGRGGWRKPAYVAAWEWWLNSRLNPATWKARHRRRQLQKAADELVEGFEPATVHPSEVGDTVPPYTPR